MKLKICRTCAIYKWCPKPMCGDDFCLGWVDPNRETKDLPTLKEVIAQMDLRVLHNLWNDLMAVKGVGNGPKL